MSHTPVNQDDADDSGVEQDAPGRICRKRAVVASAIVSLMLPILLLGIPPARCLYASKFPISLVATKSGPLERMLGAETEQDAKAILAGAHEMLAKITEETLRKQSVLAEELKPKVSPKKLKQRAETQCILYSQLVPNVLASIGANIAATKETCEENELWDYLPGKFGRALRNYRLQMCAVNIDATLTNVFQLVASLAAAVAQCSFAAGRKSSLNRDDQTTASCAAAGGFMAQGLTGLATSLQIAVPACDTVRLDVWQKTDKFLMAVGPAVAKQVNSSKLPPSKSQLKTLTKNLLDSMMTPEEIAKQESSPVLSVESEAAQGPPPLSGLSRRLLIGGGPQVLLTECVTDIFQVLTALALAGVMVDSAVHDDCQDPRMGVVSRRAVLPPLQKRIVETKKAQCSNDVASVLAELGFVVTLLSFTKFHCTLKEDPNTFCSGGVAGAFSALADLAATGSQVYSICTEGKRLNQILPFGFRTEKLVQQSIANYLHKKEENTIRSSCPDLTKACFMEFIQFFSNCPVGYVTKSCPRTPSAELCPGVQPCIDQFNQYRPIGTEWFPGPGTLNFSALVNNAPECFSYLSCVEQTSRRLEEDSKGRLLSDAMRRSLLHKVFGPDPERVSRMHSSTASRRKMRDVQLDKRMQLVDRLWASIGRNLTEGLGDEYLLQGLVLDSNIGMRSLQEAAKEYQRKKRNTTCFSS